MPITLAEAKATMTDKVDQQVIDEFRRESYLLDKLTFDNAVSPGTGGSTLTYSYTRLMTPSTASARKLNSEYTSNEAKRKKCSADLKIFGGTFTFDRVIQNTSGSLNELTFQLNEKIKATRNLFHNLVINGDSAKNEDEFDGLDVILTGTSTEYKASVGLDLSSPALVTANYSRMLDMPDEFLSGLDGKPDALLGSSKIITKIRNAKNIIKSSKLARSDYLCQMLQTALPCKVPHLFDLRRRSVNNAESFYNAFIGSCSSFDLQRTKLP